MSFCTESFLLFGIRIAADRAIKIRETARGFLPEREKERLCFSRNGICLFCTGGRENRVKNPVTVRNELKIPVKQKTAICFKRSKGANIRRIKQISVETRESTRPLEIWRRIWVEFSICKAAFQFIK